MDAPTCNDVRHTNATLRILRHLDHRLGGAVAALFEDLDIAGTRQRNVRLLLRGEDGEVHRSRSGDRAAGDLDPVFGLAVFVRVPLATGFVRGHGEAAATAVRPERARLCAARLILAATARRPDGDD